MDLKYGCSAQISASDIAQSGVFKAILHALAASLEIDPNQKHWDLSILPATIIHKLFHQPLKWGLTL